MATLKDKLRAAGATGVIALAATFLGPLESGPAGPQLEPYKDIGGVPTWCYGETVGTPKRRYTDAECTQELIKSTRKHWDAIKSKVPESAPDSVKAAMLSVSYNVGSTGWDHPLFRVPLAVRDWQGACNAIVADWKGKRGVAKGFKATVNGKPVRGLENRRKAEYTLCIRDL